MNWFSFLLPLAIDIIKTYIYSTDTTSDDKVLDLLKETASYLAKGDTTNVSDYEAKILAEKQIN